MPPVPPTVATEQSRRIHWPSLLIPLWLLGTVFWLCLAAQRVIRFRRILRRAKPAAARLRQETRRLTEKFGLEDVSTRVRHGRPGSAPCMADRAPIHRTPPPGPVGRIEPLGTNRTRCPRVGPSASRRPSNTRAGTADSGPLVVASGGLVGPASTPPRRGTMLRRLGTVGVSRHGKELREYIAQNDRFSIRLSSRHARRQRAGSKKPRQ